MEPHAYNPEEVGRFQAFFWTAHHKLRETIDPTIQDAGMNHAIMVRGVVAGIQEVLQKYKSPIKNLATVSEPHKHVANKVHSNQHHLEANLQQTQTMIQTMHLEYAAVLQPTYQDYGGCGNYGGNRNYQGRGGRGAQCRLNCRGGCGGRASSDITD